MAAAKKPAKGNDKIGVVMGEYKKGTLHSGKPGPGKGKVVTSKKQAMAIAISEQKKKEGKK